MEQFGAYSWIIVAASIVLISFFFGGIARKTSIPSVLMLIGLGIGLQQLIIIKGYDAPDFSAALEILGIIGLIMIVLEATLDLRLNKEKLGLIFKSLFTALIGLGLAVACASYAIYYLIPGTTVAQSLIYATPLSILSSAIIIPSVQTLPGEKKEFHIYESTFSDIAGIMLFYFLISYFDAKNEMLLPGSIESISGSSPYVDFIQNLLATVAIAIVSGYLLLIIFQNITEKAKLFVLIAVLVLMYSIAKEYHLSPLIIILFFGLMVSNSDLFFLGPLKKFINRTKFKEMEEDLHSLTAETAFVVRTFFFVFFGLTIVLSSLYDLDVVIVSAAILISIYFLRFIILKITFGRDIAPQVWIAPRGLITVLLFYAIPGQYHTDLFNPGILLFVIISTGIVMTLGLIGYRILHAEEDGSEESVGESIIPGTTFTPSISTKRNWVARIIRKLLIHRRQVNKVLTVDVASEIEDTLGVKPIRGGKKQTLKKRFSKVLELIFSPRDVSLRDNRDYKALRSYFHRMIFKSDSVEGIVFDVAIFLMIILSVAIVMIQSVGGLNTIWGGLLWTIEWMLTIVFTIEYLLRIWTSDRPKKYIFSFYGLVDLLAILPLYLEILLTGVYSLGIIRIFRLLRVFRVLKLVHFLGEADALVGGLKKNAGKIVVFLFFVVIVCTVMGALMYLIEGPENGFTSIPRGVYWAVVTLTTVGYGDIHPITTIGQFMSMILMILGYGVIAVPTGLVAAGVASSVKEKRREVSKCKSCGAFNPVKSHFCHKCGVDIHERLSEFHKEQTS